MLYHKTGLAQSVLKNYPALSRAIEFGLDFTNPGYALGGIGKVYQGVKQFATPTLERMSLIKDMLRETRDFKGIHLNDVMRATKGGDSNILRYIADRTSDGIPLYSVATRYTPQQRFNLMSAIKDSERVLPGLKNKK